MASDPFYRRRERAEEAGYAGQDRKMFLRGYDAGYRDDNRAPFSPRRGPYHNGYDAGQDDARNGQLSREQDHRDRVASIGGISLADALKNARRTATRRLDEAGVPDDKQGNTEGDW